MADLNAENTRRLCEKSGFPLDGEALSNLVAYLALLEKWNRAMNLVGPSSWEDILTELVVDSFYLADFITAAPFLANAAECWDLGAGAGLPGLPLRMLWQKGDYNLVEAREKRALFLRTVLAAIPLPGLSVFQGRAEAFMPTRPKADLIVSRAFMPWQKVLALVEPHIKPGAACIFLTLEPLRSALPAGWSAVLEKSYRVGRAERRFLAVCNSA